MFTNVTKPNIYKEYGRYLILKKDLIMSAIFFFMYARSKLCVTIFHTHYNILGGSTFYLMCARRERLCVWIAPTNILFIDKSMAVQIIFFYFSYGISHGFDITLDLLLMAWNFKDILRIFF